MPHHVNAPSQQPLANVHEYETAIPEGPAESEGPAHDTPDYTADSDSNGSFGRRRGTNSWWARWMMRDRRRRYSTSEGDQDADKLMGDDLPLPEESHFMTRTRKDTRKRCNVYIFGSVSVFWGILAVLLFLNLVLGAIVLWHSKIDTTLHNWGKPGSGTDGLAWYPTDFTQDIVPIPCHSHNDYWREVPLFSAIRAGCTSVEADVWLLGDDLYVGHNTASLTQNRTFQSLYVNPLVDILSRQNPVTEFYNGTNHGVFDTNTEKTLTLLVDVKTSGPETWPWVLRQLEPLRDRGWLSFVQDDTINTRPITVVGTGETPFNVLTANSTYRDAFFDAPLESMWEDKESAEEGPNSTPLSRKGQGLAGTAKDSEFNSQNSYYASVSFGSAIGRVWGATLSLNQMKIIRGQVKGAHNRGLKVRYWDLPDWPIGLRNHVWDVLVKEGVDTLNVDDLEAATKQVW